MMRSERLAAVRAWLPWLAFPVWCLGVAWRYEHIFYAHPMTEYVYSDMQGYFDAALRYYAPGYVAHIADTVYPPGAGYFFGALHRIDPSWQLCQWVLFVFSCLTPLLIGWVGWTLFGAGVASLSVAATSLYFPWVDFFAFFLSEALFIPATVGAFALLLLAVKLRRRYVAILPAVASGLLFAAATSVKTVAIASAFLLLCGLAYWGWRRRVSGLFRVIAFVVIGMVPLLTVLGHRCTTAAEGKFCLVSNNGPVTTIFGHEPWVRSITWRDTQRGITLGWGCPVSAQRAMFNRDLVYDFGAYDSAANSKKIWEIVREDPLQTLALSFDQVSDLFYGTIPWPSSHTKWTRMALENEQLFLILGTLPALFHLRSKARAVLTFQASAASEILLCLPVLALVMTCFATQGDPRYRIPADGFIVVLASAEILRWFGGRPVSRAAELLTD